MSKQCSAKNRSGKRCGAWAVTGATKCALHADPERAAELGSKRGRRVKFRPRPDALDLPRRPLKSTEEVCELLEETINLVRRGSLDVRAANSIGVLAGIHLKALAQRVVTSERVPLPAPGESIDDPPTRPNPHPRVITVEVG